MSASDTDNASHSLGRSLTDVLARTVRKDPPKGYLEVDIGLVMASTTNPRTIFEDAALTELADNIKVHGILQPLVVVRASGGGFTIVSGERRWRAARKAGLLRVPVVIRDDADPKQLDELRIIENVQRQDLGPLELARAYQRLVEVHHLTHEQIAERVGKERASISNLIRLLALPARVQQLVDAGKVQMGHARALLASDDVAWQQQLAERCASEALTVRDIERLAKTGPPESSVPAAAKPAHLRELEQNLYHLFGSKVKITEQASGKGKLTVSFESKDHFHRIVAIMNRIVNQANLDVVKK